MADRTALAPHERPGWASAAEEPDHPLAALDGQPLGDGTLRLRLGPASRFGARYFVLLLERSGVPSRDAVLTGLHHSGSFPSYNWVEVAETNERVALPSGETLDAGPGGVAHVFRLLLGVLPPGGHLMIEYDSAQRAETAQALARAVPAIATPLGELLFSIGCGARFKDWQIAEGGTEGPRKLQAYKPPNEEIAARWRREAAADLRAFLDRDGSGASDAVVAARARAADVLRSLEGS